MSEETTGQLRRLEDLMARLQRLMQAKTGHPGGLTLSQVFVLRILDHRGQAKASDIAKITGLSPGAITQVCDELERLQFVSRSRSSDDRRVVHIALTEAGRQKLEEIRRERTARMRQLFEYLGPEDVEQLIRIIERIVQAFDMDRETVQPDTGNAE
ncbi:MAG: MarR family transcriptional regulator [Alicyclobacillus sp.]|nr:MarR family transcriptional regulator [Alicyclobacillus sp.]